MHLIPSLGLRNKGCAEIMDFRVLEAAQSEIPAKLTVRFLSAAIGINSKIISHGADERLLIESYGRMMCIERIMRSAC